MNKFSVIVPVYNSGKWIGKCIESILNQDFTNFDLRVIDDCSTDDTWDVIRSYDIKSLRNSQRRGALYNLVRAIWISPDDSIIVTVDGDDYLSDNSVLSYLDSVYTSDVWLTYGSFLPVSGRYSKTCQPIEHNITVDETGEWVENFLTPQTYRKSGVWVTSHLRTFRKSLWNHIKDEDLKEDGKYYQMAWDMAFMYPMIEMAGSHVRFIERTMYMYNDLNPNCDGKTDPKLQIETGKKIQQKPNYKEL